MLARPDGRDHPRPWNKGLLVGQKKPLQPKHVWSIRVRLEISRKWRDLALFNFAIDSKLRKCDLVNRQYSSGRVVSAPRSQSCLDAAPKKGCNSGAGHAASQTVLCGGWRSSCQGHFVDLPLVCVYEVSRKIADQDGTVRVLPDTTIPGAGYRSVTGRAPCYDPKP